jgi:hypothetical protein
VGTSHGAQGDSASEQKSRAMLVEFSRLFLLGSCVEQSNPRCATSLNRSPFPAGQTFKVRMKTQSKVCAPMRTLVFLAKLSDRKTKPTVELMGCDQL